jgi:hypothetical protein
MRTEDHVPGSRDHSRNHGAYHLADAPGVGNLAGVKILEPETFRAVGAALLAFATSSALAYRQKSWEKVKIIVIMEIVFGVLSTLAMIWGLITGALPVSDWTNVVILGGFAVVFIIFYFRK